MRKNAFDHAFDDLEGECVLVLLSGLLSPCPPLLCEALLTVLAPCRLLRRTAPAPVVSAASAAPAAHVAVASGVYMCVVDVLLIAGPAAMTAAEPSDSPDSPLESCAGDRSGVEVLELGPTAGCP